MRHYLKSVNKGTYLLICVILSALLVSCVPVEKPQAEQKWKAITNLSNAGNLDAAIAEGQKLLLNNPNDVGTLYWLADAYKEKGEYKEAEKLYLKVINEGQADDISFFTGAHIHLGSIYMNDFEKAQPHFEQALQLRPLCRDALVSLNKIYLSQGRYQKALAVSEHLLSNPGLDEINFLDFNKVYYGYRGKAFALLGLGDVDAAEAALDKLESIYPNITEWDRACLYFANDNMSMLKQLYAKMGSLGTEFKDHVSDDGHKGVEVIKVLKDSPAYKAGIWEGDVILQVGEKTFDNKEDFSSTIKSYAAGQTVAFFIMRSGQSRKINVTLGSYLDTVLDWAQRQPEIMPILAQQDTLKRIEQEIANGNLRQALQLCLDHLWVSAPGSYQRPIMKKAISIVRLLDPQPAIPEDAVRHATRAETFLKSATDINGTNKALDEFEAALRLAPWWADAWFNLGIAQKNASNPVSAIESLQMFLLAAPNDPAAPQVQREIYSLEVEAESPYQWSGQWTDGTSIYYVQRENDQANVMFVKPDSIDKNDGFHAGDLHFSGRINANRLTGKRVFHGQNDNDRRCFGETYDKETTVEMGDNGYTLSAHWQSSTYLIKSCEITALEEQTRKYYRLP